MFDGDSNPLRDLGHVKIYDPYATFEDTKSHAFKTALETEAAAFKTALLHSTVARKHKLDATEKLFETLLEEALPQTLATAQETLLWHGTLVRIQHGYGNQLYVSIDDKENPREFKDLESFGVDPVSNLYFTMKDIGDGDQTFQLDVYEMGVKSPQYSISPVGPNAAFSGDYLYYESIENRLRSSGIMRVKKTNGRYESSVFHYADKKYQVELHAPPRQPHLFIRITNALSQRLAIITGASYRWLTPVPETEGRGATLLPVYDTLYATNTGLVFKGNEYKFPNHAFLQDAAPLSDTTVLVSTVKQAKVSLYIFNTASKSYKPLFEAKEPNNIMLHSHSTVPSVTITSYYEPNTVYEIQDDSLIKIKSLPAPLPLARHNHGLATTKDGESVPYTFVSAVKKPKKLLVIAYGAYGLSSGRAYPKRWLPWLARGYAVVEAAPRGGRENGDAWYDAARTALRKQTTFDDTAAVIKAVQKRYGFQKENTAIYGRSAGGWTAAYIGQKYPQLVSAVYAEVPYLDVIRTASNPYLPLTQLEYDEFGDPTNRPEEYEALLEISPVDSAAPAPPQTPFFLVRSALHDSQVYPYESLKFSAKLRSLGWPIVVGMDGAGGHFVKRSSAAKIYAEDFLLIDAALTSRTQRKTRRQARTRPRSHTARGTIRRRRSSRKH